MLISNAFAQAAPAASQDPLGGLGGILPMIFMFAVLWFVGAPMRVIAALGSVGAVVIGLMVVTDPERMHRLFSFVNPSDAVSDQPMNAIYALASGGWWGVGLGHSRQKWGGLYNGAQTDYVLAVLGEEMGLVGTLIVLCLFFVLAFTGLRIAARSSNRLLAYAASGMTAAAPASTRSRAVLRSGYIYGRTMKPSLASCSVARTVASLSGSRYFESRMISIFTKSPQPSSRARCAMRTASSAVRAPDVFGSSVTCFGM